MGKQKVEVVTSHGAEFLKVTGDHGVGFVPTSMPLEAMVKLRDKLLRKLATAGSVRTTKKASVAARPR
jgi:hypothetical protein